MRENDWAGYDVYDTFVANIDFINELQVIFRDTFPLKWNDFLQKVFSDKELTANILAFMLQNSSHLADELEDILQKGGSAYSVKIVEDGVDWKSRQASLVLRVPQVVVDASSKALQTHKILHEAWQTCYRHQPDYSKTVRLCNDFLEGFLRDRFWPTDIRTKSISVCMKEFKKQTDLLTFKGDSFLDDKSKLISLLEGISRIRGEHTTGEGREPTPSEAEYVLHTTIYIWNLMSD